MRLEIGNRSRRLGDEWTTLDIEGDADIIADIRKPLPVGDSTCELVYLSHVLEHVPWTETVKVLKDIHRIVKPNGSIEVHVPDAKKIMMGYFKWPLPVDEGEDWWKGNPRHDPWIWLNGRLLRGPIDPGEPEHERHLALFSEEHLTWCLHEAGFSNVMRLSKPRGHDHGWINLGLKGTK